MLTLRARHRDPDIDRGAHPVVRGQGRRASEVSVARLPTARGRAHLLVGSLRGRATIDAAFAARCSKRERAAGGRFKPAHDVVSIQAGEALIGRAAT